MGVRGHGEPAADVAAVASSAEVRGESPPPLPRWRRRRRETSNGRSVGKKSCTHARQERADEGDSDAAARGEDGDSALKQLRQEIRPCGDALKQLLVSASSFSCFFFLPPLHVFFLVYQSSACGDAIG